MKTTLLIMAAGIGSRFGTGIKQLEPVDDAGHIIMDYSIHDAIEAGFNHVVFIIRKDIEKEFKEVIGDRIASICSSHNVTVDYALVLCQYFGQPKFLDLLNNTIQPPNSRPPIMGDYETMPKS